MEPAQIEKIRRGTTPLPPPFRSLTMLLPYIAAIAIAPTPLRGQICPGGPPGFFPNMTNPMAPQIATIASAGPPIHISSGVLHHDAEEGATPTRRSRYC